MTFIERMYSTTHTNLFAWFVSHGIEIDMGTDAAEEQKMAAKMTEGTVQRHFNGK